MKNEVILRKAIEKAVGNGWKKGTTYLDYEVFRMVVRGNEYYTIIFSSDFARAFWKIPITKIITVKRNIYNWATIPATVILTTKHKRRFKDKRSWESHLQQMVKLPDDERIKYLEKFL